MRRSSSSPTMQLFPFLAVLVCVMGALILFLLVTTRKMRQVAETRANAARQEREDREQERENQAPPPALLPTDMEDAESSARYSQELAQREREREAALAARRERQQRNEAERQRQAELEATWQRELAAAETERDQTERALATAQRELDQLRGQLASTETNLSKLRDKQSKIRELESLDSQTLAEAEKEHARLTADIEEAQRRLAALRRAHADAASKFAFIPYDGASGTTRQPIYIECTREGIRFQPENELLDEHVLQGFTESYNPLLLAADRLLQYLKEKSRKNPQPGIRSAPYILLIVRPSGTVAYYVARKMLSELGDDFGYELVMDDFQLQLAESDPEAKLVIQRAVAEAMRNRGRVASVGGQEVTPRLGPSVLGGREDVIEFGSLSDEFAANHAREASPFADEAPADGRGYSITRSPVPDRDMVAARRNRLQVARDARASDNLGSLRNQVRPPDSTIPQNLAEMTQGRDENGVLQQRINSGPASLTPGGGRASEAGSQTYALTDPQRATAPPTGARGSGSSRAETEGGGGFPQVASEIDPRQFDGTGSGDQPGSGGDLGVSSDTGDVGDAGRTSRPLGTGSKVTDIMPDAIPPEELERADKSTLARAGRSYDGPSSARRTGAGGDIDLSSEQRELAEEMERATAGTPSRSQARDASETLPRARTSPTATRSDRERTSQQAANGRPGNPAGTAARTSSGTRTNGARGNGTPGVKGQRVYGDNPEARRQLAAMRNKAVTPAQKRDLAKSRWGGTNTGQIGFERQVDVQVYEDRILIGKDDYVEIVVESGTKGEELVESVLEGLDEHSQAWGRPPSRFYWVPYVKFDVQPGGHINYERLNRSLREWGVFSESNLGDPAPAATQPQPAVTAEPPRRKRGFLNGVKVPPVSLKGHSSVDRVGPVSSTEQAVKR